MRSKDRVLLILIALLILGILGGIGFGYLLTLSHAAGILPSQTYIVWWVG